MAWAVPFFFFILLFFLVYRRRRLSLWVLVFLERQEVLFFFFPFPEVCLFRFELKVFLVLFWSLFAKSLLRDSKDAFPPTQ